MRTLAVLPIKNFSSAKRRLSTVLASGSRSTLAQAMFADVLSALRRSRAVDAIAVVTAETAAESLALSDGAMVLRDRSVAGQSAAAEIGIRQAEKDGFDRVVLVPGDTPLLTGPDLDLLLDRSADEGIEVAIVPDRHLTGTNALAISPPGAFAPSFGPGSFARHLEQAKRSGLAYRIIEVPSLAHDLDTPEDLEALWPTLSSHRMAQRTRGALRQFQHAGVRAKLEASKAEEPVKA